MSRSADSVGGALLAAADETGVSAVAVCHENLKSIYMVLKFLNILNAGKNFSAPWNLAQLV